MTRVSWKLLWNTAGMTCHLQDGLCYWLARPQTFLSSLLTFSVCWQPSWCADLPSHREGLHTLPPSPHPVSPFPTHEVEEATGLTSDHTHPSPTRLLGSMAVSSGMAEPSYHIPSPAFPPLWLMVLMASRSGGLNHS
jgi:hypothetical protein